MKIRYRTSKNRNYAVCKPHNSPVKGVMPIGRSPNGRNNCYAAGRSIGKQLEDCL